MNERKYGCLESPKDLRDYKVCKSISNIELPDEYKLKPASIKDQGYVNSCVAHSISSMIEEKEGEVYSTGWIYGYRPEGYYQGEGMYMRDALKTIQKLGAVKNKDFDRNTEMQGAKNEVDKNIILLEALAEDYKIESYARLDTVKEIKQWIYTKQTPVPLAIATDDLIVDDKNIIQIPKVYPNSGHAILCLGWNKQGLIIQNSWGKDWGDNGLATLPYEYTIREAWGVLTPDSPNKDVKKPSYYIIRNILQLILDIIKSLKKGK